VTVSSRIRVSTMRNMGLAPHLPYEIAHVHIPEGDHSLKG